MKEDCETIPSVSRVANYLSSESLNLIDSWHEEFQDLEDDDHDGDDKLKLIDDPIDD